MVAGPLAGDPAEEATRPAHAVLSASSSERWMNCPGSIAASRGIEDRSSIYAVQGSAAHEVAALCLQHAADPEDYLGKMIEVKGEAKVEVDREMVDAVQVYVDEVKRRAAGADISWVERTFNLNSIQPPAAMYGTTDFAAYFRDRQRLLVMDFKYGAGTPVEAQGNPQLRYYALGALLSLPDLMATEVEIVVVQPRAGGVREETIDAVDLMDFTTDLLAAANLAVKPGAPLAPGKWCKFCRAKPHCEALRRFNVATTIAAFDDGAVFDEDDAEMIGPNIIDDDTLSRVLHRGAQMEDWLKAIREEAFRRLNVGRAVPGWKLVAKRSRRRWTDDGQAESVLDMLGVPEDQMWKRTLVSPAQAEKLVDKAQRPRLSGLVASVSGGPTLAPDTDKRPALAAGMFSALADDDDTY